MTTTEPKKRPPAVRFLFVPDAGADVIRLITSDWKKAERLEFMLLRASSILMIRMQDREPDPGNVEAVFATIWTQHSSFEVYLTTEEATQVTKWLAAPAMYSCGSPLAEWV